MGNKNTTAGKGNTSVAGNRNEVNQNGGTQKRSYCPYWISGISLFISISCFALIAFSHESVFDSISIVLGFIGIMATFIVVGNYIQVKAAEDKVENLQRDLDKTKEDIQGDIKDVRAKIKDIQIENAKLRGRLFCINPLGFFDEER